MTFRVVRCCSAVISDAIQQVAPENLGVGEADYTQVASRHPGLQADLEPKLVGEELQFTRRTHNLRAPGATLLHCCNTSSQPLSFSTCLSCTLRPYLQLGSTSPFPLLPNTFIHVWTQLAVLTSPLLVPDNAYTLIGQ